MSQARDPALLTPAPPVRPVSQALALGRSQALGDLVSRHLGDEQVIHLDTSTLRSSRPLEGGDDARGPVQW
jgi:hypothetical protein